MHSSSVIKGTTAIITLQGRFVFDCHETFKHLIAPLMDGQAIHEIHLDFTALDYLDSNALGMLLLLREKAQKQGIAIHILNPSRAVMEILDMVQFDKLFTILGSGRP